MSAPKYQGIDGAQAVLRDVMEALPIGEDNRVHYATLLPGNVDGSALIQHALAVLRLCGVARYRSFHYWRIR